MKQAAAKTTTKSGNTRSPGKNFGTPPSLKPQKTANHRQDFFIAALNMSWQLAIVVLVPILIGYNLDKHLHSLPVWTGVGFLLAMASMAAVVWRQLMLFGLRPTKASIAAAKKLRDKEDDDQ